MSVYMHACRRVKKTRVGISGILQSDEDLQTALAVLQNCVTVRRAKSCAIFVGQLGVPKLILHNRGKAVLDEAEVPQPVQPDGDLVDTDEEAAKKH